MTIQSYEDWLKAVDRQVWALVGCSLHDLPDVPQRDWYDEGLSAYRAAKRAVAYANGDDWDDLEE